MQRQRFGIAETVGEADRKVSPQPLVYTNNEGVVSRKMLKNVYFTLRFGLIS